MKYTHFQNLETLQEVPEKGILSRTIFDDEHVKIVLFAFAEGEELSEHTASMPANMHFLRGEAHVTLGEDKHQMSAGAWVQMPPGLKHSIQAQTPVVMLLSLIKSESE